MAETEGRMGEKRQTKTFQEKNREKCAISQKNVVTLHVKRDISN